MPVTTPTMPGAGYEELLYRGPALAQLRILKQQMKLGGLKCGSRRVNLGNGVECFCEIIFNDERVYVTVPKTEDQPISYGGIIMHPRSGPIVAVVYYSYTNVWPEGYTRHSNYVRGVVGGWRDGTAALTTGLLFPLVDTDNASFLVSKPLDTVKGQFTKGFSSYGNLYYQHAGQGFVISFRGPPVRHASIENTIEIPGLSAAETATWNPYTDDTTIFTVFGTVLYQGGSVLVSAPRYTWPYNGSDRCLILGAMKNSAGEIFIVTQSDRLNAPASVSFGGITHSVEPVGLFLVLWKTGTQLDGWNFIAEHRYGRNGLAWFGNASGTEFVCSNGDRLTAGGNLTLKTSHGSGTSTESEGTVPRDMTITMDYTGNGYLSEFKGDDLAAITTSLAFSSVSEHGAGSWVLQSSEGPGGMAQQMVVALTATTQDIWQVNVACWPDDGFLGPYSPNDVTDRLPGFVITECTWQDYLGYYNKPGHTRAILVSHESYAWEGRQPGAEHVISTNYMANICGVQVPIVRTDRTWSDSRYDLRTAQARSEGLMVSSVQEDCVIEKSTIHYLDHRYGVCLYRYQKDEIHMQKTSNRVANMIEYNNSTYHNEILITDEDYTATTTEEWRLIVDGVQTVLCSTTLALIPFGEPLGSGAGADQGVCMVLIPTLPVFSYGWPGEDWDDPAFRLGFYEEGYMGWEGEITNQTVLDGGRDYFYPAWCRSLQSDPFWAEAAAARVGHAVMGIPLRTSASYTPPITIPIEPLPIGSFARHPAVGDIYQFLITKFDGNSFLASSGVPTTLVNTELAKAGLATHDTTLYYPISVI